LEFIAKEEKDPSENSIAQKGGEKVNRPLAGKKESFPKERSIARSVSFLEAFPEN